MRLPVLLLLLLTLRAVNGFNNINDGETTFIFESSPPPPEASPPSPLESPSPSPASPDQGPIPPDYLPIPKPDISPSPLPSPSPSPAPFPPLPPIPSNLPSWLKPIQSSFVYREYQRNLAFISAIDRKKKQADVLVYGDSITALSKPTNLSTGIKGNRKPWDANFGDLNAEPLGIPGNRIGNLMYRLAVAKERPKFRDPKVIVIFVGVNDLRDRTPPKEIKKRMEFVVKWLAKEMPDTKIVLQALLPGLSQVDNVNIKFKKLAREYNIKFSTCGSTEVRYDRSTYMADKLHPNLSGQNVWLKCLRKEVVQPLLDNY